MGDVVWAAEFAQNGWIEDLSRRMYSDYSPQVPDAFLDAPLSTVPWQNKLWGVPWFTDAGLLYYRRDLLDDAGLGQPPTTWDGLKGIAGQVKQQAGTKYGFVFQGAEYEGGVVNGAEFLELRRRYPYRQHRHCAARAPPWFSRPTSSP